ncbi:MAG: N-acetylmuramic acid 6-phosphate etherase [Armatimonadetes bacterium]|nr:N-acetylmuramic acid 6-phosphate etherase [Armatimonadota bacterium]
MRTEERNPASENLDRMSPVEIVRLMSREDEQVGRAVLAAEEEIVRAIEAVADCYGRGGTTIYVGAGTSGRVAGLDVAELPPTFGVEPGRFVVLAPGGTLGSADEAAEDNRNQARRDLENLLRSLGPGARRGEEAVVRMPAGAPVRSSHLAVGITASGTTPYVLEAISCAAENGLPTIGVCNNPGAPLLDAVDIPVLLDTGPEVITGSTRLKAGTAQKMTLNMISVGAMVLCGRVRGNLMSHMNPVSEKLRLRAVRIVRTQLGLGETEARRVLEESNWSLSAVLREKVRQPAAE